MKTTLLNGNSEPKKLNLRFLVSFLLIAFFATINLQAQTVRAPVANAGTDQTFTCVPTTGQPLITLDGSGSLGADFYTWSENGVILGTVAILQINLAPGIHVINLHVSRTGSLVESDASITININIGDGLPPTINQLADINTTATSVNGAYVNYFAPVGADICSTPTTVLTEGLASGALFPIGTTKVTYTVTDNEGLTATSSFNVIVTGVAPAIVCPGDITVNNDLGMCGANVTFAATGFLGFPATTITYSQAPGSYFEVGTTPVTVTAGTSTCTFNVIVNDTEKPTVITKNYTVDLDETGQVNLSPGDVNDNLNTKDNCGIASMSVSPNVFTAVGTYPVTLTVTDIHGNSNTALATVTVSAHQVGSCNSTIAINNFTAVNTQKPNTIFLGYGPQSKALSTLTTGGTGFTYVWTSTTAGEIVASVANPTVSPKVSTTYTVTATSAEGCTATASIYVCVIDARVIDSHGKSEGKVLVCHNEGPNSGRSHTIEISANAVEQHLTLHGDTLGACDATCTTTYKAVIASNCDDDDDHNDHSNKKDDNDHSSNCNDDDDDHKDHSGDDDHDSKSKESDTKVVVYPNSFGDECVIGLNHEGEGSVEIYDSKGTRVFIKDSKDLKGGISVNMKGKKSGTYFARVTCKGKVYTANIYKDR